MYFTSMQVQNARRVAFHAGAVWAGVDGKDAGRAAQAQYPLVERGDETENAADLGVLSDEVAGFLAFIGHSAPESVDALMKIIERHTALITAPAVDPNERPSHYCGTCWEFYAVEPTVITDRCPKCERKLIPFGPPAVDAGTTDDGLPAVGGEMMDRSIVDFDRACRVLLMEEQERPSPNNALIAVLCDAVRCSRELVRAMSMPSAPAVDDETVKLDAIPRFACVISRNGVGPGAVAGMAEDPNGQFVALHDVRIALRAARSLRRAPEHEAVKPDPSTITPEWCVEAFYRVNPGAGTSLPRIPSLYLLDFAREVLWSHSPSRAESAADPKTVRLLERLAVEQEEWAKAFEQRGLVASDDRDNAARLRALAHSLRVDPEHARYDVREQGPGREWRIVDTMNQVSPDAPVAWFINPSAGMAFKEWFTSRIRGT